MTTFLALIGATSRTNVALSILNSTEARTRRVQGWYTQFLRRSATSAEASALLGAADEDAMAAILASDEYFNFASLLITTTPPTATTNFWVRASNTCGTTDSTTATVTIPCNAPVIVAQPADATINIGDSPTSSWLPRARPATSGIKPAPATNRIPSPAPPGPFSPIRSS